MKKFVAIYYSNAEAQAASASMTPEAQAKGLEKWMTWNAKSGDQIVDLGAPLAPALHLNQEGDWSPSSKTVSGYSIVQAESLENAKALFVNHPHTNWSKGCTIEVHETVKI